MKQAKRLDSFAYISWKYLQTSYLKKEQTQKSDHLISFLEQDNIKGLFSFNFDFNFDIAFPINCNEFFLQHEEKKLSTYYFDIERNKSLFILD